MESRSIRAALPAFVLLFLLSLVELINDTTVSARNPHWRPGFWDAGTARVIVTHVSSFITVLAQLLGPILVARLSRHSSHWSGLMAGLLCLTADGIAIFLDSRNCATHELSQDESDSTTDPLWPGRQYSHEGSSHPDDGVVSPVGLLKICLGLKAPPREKILGFTPWIFFFIAISQASRPLFATYAQQRCGLSPTDADNLWLLRSEISLFIFGVLLPCLISMEGVILMALGAIMISVSDSSIAITIGSCFLDFLNNLIDDNEGLIINTFGVSSNLSLLCFIANRLPSSAVGPVLMSFALSESVGSLVGIVIIYPAYQWSIDEKTPFYAGSLLYIFCGTKLNYAAIAAVIWRSFGKSHQQETEA
ncbi:hypothetical protein FOXB_06350 [Fusarium oxysporum f. sp. conglutinans Fo5176]|uniref:Uncharacterized protein n=1 Tax=Fusarium oxysporum (strain Fo5176) TaxID=660025 RepID=F9FIX1_FUSOF|nr:hypothetical protein FOXB_06350 [Fusarium oxysporum f. sp. conglutinans Fo5176]